MESKLDTGETDGLPLPTIVFRAAWGAMPRRGGKSLTLPVNHVLFTFTKTEECDNQLDCNNAVRQLQKRDMNARGLSDIQYNYLVGGDATIFEGRGAEINADKDIEHADLDGKSIDIAFIGNYRYKHPTKEMTSAAGGLVKYLIQVGAVTEEFAMTPLGYSQDIEEDEESDSPYYNTETGV